MKRILREAEFTDEQLNIIRRLSDNCGLCFDTVKILYGRGVCDEESINKFIHPSKEHFISPFKMSGMREAVELITKARDEEWAVVVYGDYDADGVCAATIMASSLRDFGIEPVVCVPERNDGYGLSKTLIDAIFDEHFPQLFITVDCGISCAEEVEYIKELGAEVIVTDHHELPDIIPYCICINPKFNDGYIYDNLCGAGVAFKVGCALNGESAYKYLDFAAIATVADSVPLTGENRDIVYEGLRLINKAPRAVYSAFLSKTDESVNAHSLAFSIAPKINAAGRMGDAKSALQLFNETDKKRISDLSAKLTEYNLERQKYCDELYISAKQMATEQGFGNIIMLCNENWNSGFVGIVAARLADEFSRPTILFVKNGEMLKGSARSVESVNIFEALRACSCYISEFGGHSQAAGVNVTEENFNALRNALDKYIGENYNSVDFVPTVHVSGELNGAYSARFAKELDMLEPFGVGNKRPMFVTEEKSVSAKPIKAGSAHLSVKSEKIDLMFFGGARYAKLIESNAPKKFIFEYNISSFRGKEYIKGFIRDVIYERDAAKLTQEEAQAGAVEMLSLPEINCKKTVISSEEAENAAADCKPFGTVFITWDYSNACGLAGLEKLNVELFNLSVKNGASCVLVAPPADIDLKSYNRVIIIDGEVGVRIPSLENRSVEILKPEKNSRLFANISCNREHLLKIFAFLSANEGAISGATAEEVVFNNDFGLPKAQIMFALKVFEQLSLIDISPAGFKVNRGIKRDLKNSQVYNAVLNLQAE